MTDSPSHEVKELAVADYQQRFGYSVFIETGTFQGDMVEAQKRRFETVVSIELGIDLYERAKSRFAGDNNVILIQGDSGTMLPQIMDCLQTPAIFWLDGHYSAGITAKGEKDCPIFEELDAIFSSSDLGHVILIDDARCFGVNEGFPTVEEVAGFIRNRNDSYRVEIRDDIIRCVRCEMAGDRQSANRTSNSRLELEPSGGASDLDELRRRGLATVGKPLRLHLGCGESRFDGYVNIDYPSDQHNVMQVMADYHANITQLDFPPASVDEIRLHHVFEHFSRVTALAMLIKWQIWLKTGGKLIIETPDLKGSAELLASNPKWNVQMAMVRHLAGDQAASWAYHTDHWFPARFEHTFKKLGFGIVETSASRWPQEPYLCNVQVLGIKTEDVAVDRLIEAADELLWESTVSPMEKPTYDVWTQQLRHVLAGGYCGPAMESTVSAPPVPMAESTVHPEANQASIPLAEIHDFNQRARDRWVLSKAQSVPAGLRVLDVGAGTCLYRPLFAHCEYRTHDFAAYEGVKHGGGTEYGAIDYVSDILAIPVPDASFDVILCTEVLEHVPEPIKVLAEISRILRPGGRAFITAPLGSHLHQLPFHFYGGYTPEWYKRFGPANGLYPTEITPNGGFFKHLAQECARAAYMYSQHPELHGADAAGIVQLLSDSMPRFFYEMDDKCFDDKCTVGFQVELVKTANPSEMTDSSVCLSHKNGSTPTSGKTKESVSEAQMGGLNKGAKLSPPVVVKLMGGLGNQMFEYGMGLALARKNGVGLKLDLRFLQDKTPRPNFTRREYDLGCFRLAPDCELITDSGKMPQDLHNVTEKHFHFDPDVSALGGGLYLDGYWQSPRYFESVREEVKRTFTSFTTPLNSDQQKIAAHISAKNAVCVHVRRTDMVSDPVIAAIHGACGVGYFAEAGALIAKRHPDAHFFVFSDDIDWCRSSGILFGHPHTFIEHSSPEDHAAVDLQLMMLCRHFIISNSTFGWWAAYLTSNTSGTVIMPEPWLGDPTKETSDLVPEGWIRLAKSPGPLPPALTNVPMVSVIIPCFKQSHYLPEAVASVVAQTCSDWEIIIVNDGSPDNTSEVARELIELHPARRIRLLEKKNGGLADARNEGIKCSAGRYILPLDADDKIHPQMLEKTLAVLERQPKISIVYTDLMRFGHLSGLLCASEFDFDKLCQQNQLNYCSLYRRKVFETVGGYNSNMRWGYEDWDFWIGCGEQGYVAQRLGEALFFYRTKRESMVTVADAHREELVAQIVLNHLELYVPQTRTWAAKVIKSIRQAEEVSTSGDLSSRADAAPVVSVVVACYNQAQYLGEAVESVVAQTYDNWEVIIVNDGSTDATSEVARGLLRRYSARRIRLVEKANGGAADARNAGIHHSKGRYILPLDADDKLAPDFLVKTVKLLEENRDIAIAYTDWNYFGEMEGRRDAIEWNFQHLCEKENLFTCTSLFRREAWQMAGGFNTNMTKGVEDWDFWISCAEKGCVGRRIPEALFYYRAKSQSRNKDLQPFFPVMLARIILNHPDIYGPELTEKAGIVFNSADLPPSKPSSPGREGFPDQSGDCELADVAPGDPSEHWALKLSGKRVMFWLDPGLAPDQIEAVSVLADIVEGKGAEIHAACSATQATAFSEKQSFRIHEANAGFRSNMESPGEDSAEATQIFGEAQADLIVFVETNILASSGAKHAAMENVLPFLSYLVGEDAGAGFADGPEAGSQRKYFEYSRYAVVDSGQAKSQLLQAADMSPEDICVQDSTAWAAIESNDTGRIDGTLCAVVELIGRAASQTNQELGVRRMNALIRSGEIIELLQEYREGLENSAVPPVTGGSDLSEYTPDTISVVKDLAKAWNENPKEAILVTQLRMLRRSMAALMVSSPDSAAGSMMNGSFGVVYRTLLESGLQDESPTEEERGVGEFLTGGFDEKGDFSFLRLAAFMLFRRSHRAPAIYALEVLPKWFLKDYLKWVFSTPAVLVEVGEADRYASFLSGWLKEILRRGGENSQIELPLPEVIALALDHLNLIPAYCSTLNNRKLMEMRAALIESSLTAAGAVLDSPVARQSSPVKNKRIRIGVLNAHFGLQTETFVTLPALHLDRSKFEICLFAGFANHGEVESSCRSHADHFRVLPSSLPEQVRIIREAKLDAIIVGTNITAVTNGMCLLAAHRLAPVQLLSHCSPMTSGFRNVDGILSGSLAYSPGLSEAEFTEKLVLLDGPPLCLDYASLPAGSGGPGNRAKYGISPDEFIFCNAASCFKIPIELMDAWAQILRQVPNSRLLLLPFNPNWSNKFPQAQFERTLENRLRRQGVDKNRVILGQSLPSRTQVMELEKVADLYLDTFPFSGSIATVDPLELGIPVLAKDGQTTRSRCAGAQLREIGIPELVAKNTEDYIRIAVRFAKDPDSRLLLGERIRTSMGNSPRFLDPNAYGRELSRALECIVRQGWDALPEAPRTPATIATGTESAAKSSDQEIHSQPGSLAEPSGSTTPIVSDSQTPMQLLSQAREAVLAMQWTTVEELCRQLLECAPETADAWAMLSELAFRSGDLEYASDLIGQALELDPNHAEMWLTCGRVRHGRQDLDGALSALRTAVTLRPAFPEASLMIAVIHEERNDPILAEKSYIEAIRASKDPNLKAQCRVRFAGFLRAQNRIKEGIKQLRKAVSGVPESIETLLLLGHFLQEGGELLEAMSTFIRISIKFPENGSCWLEWGRILLLLGKNDEALDKMRRAAKCRPNDPEILFNLGYALQQNIQRTEALQIYLEAERAGCDTGDLHTNIGVILKDQERYMEAAHRFHKGLERNPESFAALNNLGAVCINLGLTTEAIECFEEALRLNPTMSAAHSNLGHMLKISGKAKEGMDYYLKGLMLDPGNKEMMHNYLLSTLYQANFTPQDIFEEHRKWGNRLAAGIKRLPRRTSREGDSRGKKMRIGYISPDLCRHPVSFFAEALMSGYDRQKFEVYVYSDVHKSDAVTARFRSSVDVWRDISEMQNREAGELIQADEIDILVELCGHTAHNRLEVLAAKPAPITVSYLGYPATSGMPGVDFRITDGIADPLGQTEAWHTEKLIRLDRCAWCYAPPAGSPPVGPLPADRNGFITFGCFNNLAKLNVPLYQMWLNILRQVPDSRLFLKAKTLIDPKICQEIRTFFELRGLSPERLRISGFENSANTHFDRYNEVDIALDCYPYHGTTTTCEALWMGVPVVTRVGDAHLSRVGASLLQAVGHSELVATSEEDYIRLAVELAGNPSLLRALRSDLRGQMQRSPLLDPSGFIRAIEGAFLSLLPRPDPVSPKCSELQAVN